MTMHKALHSRDYTDRLYASRKEDGRELVSTEDALTQSLETWVPVNNLITTGRPNLVLISKKKRI